MLETNNVKVNVVDSPQETTVTLDTYNVDNLPESVSTPIGSFTREEVVFVMSRIKTGIPDARKMSNYQLFSIATEVLAYKIVPGIDKYYWVNKDGEGNITVQSSWHYQYLAKYANYCVKRENGADATFNYSLRSLNVDERREHKVKDTQSAAMAKCVSESARRKFMEGLRELKELLEDPKLALTEAKQMHPYEYTAVGVQVRYAPSGFSAQHDAEKMAIKNLVMRVYGTPTPSEGREISDGKLWDYFRSADYSPHLPIEAQEKLASLIQPSKITPKEAGEASRVIYGDEGDDEIN